MEIPRVPLDFKKQADWTYDDYKNQEARTTSGEAVDAMSELAFRDTGLGLLARYKVVNEFEKMGVEKISPEEANKRHPNLRVPFREPVNPFIAQLRSDEEEQKTMLMDKISRGPSDMWTKTKVFGAGLTAHLMDPIEFGSGQIIGWGVGGLALKGAFGAKVAATSTRVAQGTASTSTRIGLNLGRETIGSAIENVSQEVGQAIIENKEGYVDDRTGGEILTDIAINTFAASIVGTGIAEGAFQLKGIKRMLRETSPEADLAVARTNLSALETELRIDNTPILRTLAKETDALPQDFAKSPYQFTPVTEVDVKTKKFFATTRESTDDIAGATKAALGDDYGFGTHLTDNPGVANAAAVRSMADHVGAVHEVEVGDLKPIYLGQPLPDGNLKKEIEYILKSIEFDGAEEAINMESAKTALDFVKYAEDANLVPEGTLTKLKESIQADGYNAMISDGSQRMGFEHGQHNHVILLDDGLLKKGSSFEPDKTVIRSPTKEELNAVIARNTDPSNMVFSNKPQYDLNMEQIKDIQVQTRNDVAAIRSETEKVLAELDDQVKQGLVDIRVVQALKDGLQDIEDEHTILKAFTSCVRG